MCTFKHLPFLVVKLSELSDEDLLLVGVHARVLVQYPGHRSRIFSTQQQNRKQTKKPSATSVTE
jgi:hypothetical protein